MKDLLDHLDRWEDANHRVVLARVVGVDGSGPRDPGAAMAVNEAGEVIGSVSGGCVESAVVEAALELLAQGEDAGGKSCLKSFGYSDSDAFAVGLTCGGTVHLLLEELPTQRSQPGSLFEVLFGEIRAGRPVALATTATSSYSPSESNKPQRLLVRPKQDPIGDLGDENLNRVANRDALGRLESAKSETRHYGPHGEAGEDAISVFFDSFAPKPRMLVFGAIDFSGALVRAAQLLGFYVMVCDARTVFATRQRFPTADELHVSWPDRLIDSIQANPDASPLGPNDAVCVLTHDPKFDVPAIQAALATNVGYIGVMGSRRTDERRKQLLLEAGSSEKELEMLHSPIGLDLGGRTPEEVAVSILAEIVATRTGHGGVSLSDTTGPLH